MRGVIWLVFNYLQLEGTSRAYKCLKRCDVALMMLDT
jgi:hypothetical protein